MSNLNKQLTEICDNAQRLIAQKLQVNNGSITIETLDNCISENGYGLTNEFMDKSIMLTHCLPHEGNEDLWLLDITGDKNNCNLTMVTEYENSFVISLFELDAHNLTLLADYFSN